MGSKHTPGPWEIGTNKEAAARGTTALPIWGPDGQAVAWIEDRGGGTRDNARLIAAAPEMADAMLDAIAALNEGVRPALLGASDVAPAASMRFAAADKAKVADHTLAEVIARLSDALKKAGVL